MCEAQGGGETAWDEIYRHFFPLMVKFFWRNPADAEDLAEEVLVSVWRHRDRFDGSQASLKTWIFVIATNVWKDYCRRAGRRVQESDLKDAEGNPRAIEEVVASDERKNPSSRLKTEDADALVRAALASLPPYLRVVVELRDMEGLDLMGAAEVLGTSKSTVGVNHSRALKQMLQFMAEARASDAPSEGRRNKATSQERNQTLSERLSEIGPQGGTL